jgi:hypothetical protein
MMPRGRKTLRLLTDPPKGRRDDELRGPEGGFWKRLLNDDQNVDKLEDKHPFNTFVEILLGIIALGTTISAILQGLVALKDLGWLP